MSKASYKIMIQSKSSDTVLAFKDKADFLEWVREKSIVYTMDYSNRPRKEIDILLWLEWNSIFEPSKYTCEDVIYNLTELSDWRFISDPIEKARIRSLKGGATLYE